MTESANRGRFVAGQSGNTKGRPRGVRKSQPLARLCREGTYTIYRRLMQVVKTGADRDATAAGTVLLAYAWGRPRQEVDLLALHKFAGSLTPDQQEELGHQVLQLEAQQPDMFGFDGYEDQPERVLDAAE